jgi:hypothetical protein
VAVGKDAGVDCLNQSTAAWMDLYEKIDNAIKSGDTVTLEVHAPPDV